MRGYIDMHCHVLPGVDDGSGSMKETLRMVQTAYKEGIRAMIVTPHYHPRRGMADAAVVREALRHVQSEVHKLLPDMRLYPGNEIYYRQDAKELLREGTLLTLAGSDYVLVEFSMGSVTPEQIADAVRDLQMGGYLPVIAHIERYDRLLGDVDAAMELVEAGAYIQVNAASVTGELGGNRKRYIRKLIKNDCVHFVGTDAHDTGARAPLMKKCASCLTRKFGEEVCETLLCVNPGLVLQNEII